MIEINMIFVNNKIERNASYLPASETIHRLEDYPLNDSTILWKYNFYIFWHIIQLTQHSSSTTEVDRGGIVGMA